MVVIDIQEQQRLRLRQITANAEDSWLNRLADEAEFEGAEGSVSRRDGCPDPRPGLTHGGNGQRGLLLVRATMRTP
ncbi:hypothetical protein [Streptomyces sp. B21-083]|uniref:hypothetical protein n=1 Tax=Streptomyces sp. B21-083 TaxID=3039410 RepID=UPI002FEF361E